MAPNDIDLNVLTIAELQKQAHEMMDKNTRDYYNESVFHQRSYADAEPLI